MFGSCPMFWRVNRERALVLGGPAALLLQIAHPLVATAVARQTDFTREPVERLRRTLRITLEVIFGDTSQASAAASSVRDIHHSVHGRLPAAAGQFPEGTVYDATDPELLLWAHATIVWVGLGTYERFVRRLSQRDRERYLEESKGFGLAFGLGEEAMPKSYRELTDYVSSMFDGPALVVGAEARRLAVEVLHPSGPASVRAAAPMSRIITAGLLPERLRAAFGLTWGRRERVAFRAVSATARGTVRALPRRVRWWPHYRTAQRRAAGTSLRTS